MRNTLAVVIVGMGLVYLFDQLIGVGATKGFVSQEQYIAHNVAMMLFGAAIAFSIKR